MTREEILRRLVDVGPALIGSVAKPGPHCVMATTIGQMALARIGIHADPYPVSLNICNQAWVEWAKQEYHGGLEEQVRRGAYLLSNTPNFRGVSFSTVKITTAWDGHLVLRVPDFRGRRWLVDLDLGSFNRPQHDILVPGGLVAPLSPDGKVSGTLTDDTGVRTAVHYGPLDAPYANDYLTARDWKQRDRFEGYVDDLLRAMRG